jgi:dephospho-CoA kinase
MKAAGNQPKLIGLTGTYCAGKNYVAGLLEGRGFPALDVDKLGHAAIEAEKAAVLARFGPGVLGGDGAVDRRLLGKRVFGRPGELAALEGIVHPAANRMTGEWIARQSAAGCRALVINAALLHRSSAFDRLDCIILVRAPLLTRLFRARKRDRLPFPELIRRFRSQKKFIPQYLQGKTDIYIVDNPGCFGFDFPGRRSLENRIDEIVSNLKF